MNKNKKMNFGKTFFACLLAVIVASIIGFIFSLIIFFSVAGAIASLDSEADISVKDNSVLKISTNSIICESIDTDPFSMIDFNSFKIVDKCTILNAVNAITSAAEDPSIAGIVIEGAADGGTLSQDHVYQLRKALEKFHNESGKFILAYGDNLSVTDYWLSSIADDIYVNPQGTVEWIGLSGQLMFFKDALDKLGIEPQIFRVGKYKSAVEPFMRSEMSDENRIQNEEMLKSIWSVIVNDVSESREIAPEILNGYADNLTIVSPEDALSCQMVDSLSYKNDFLDKVSKLVDAKKSSDINFLTLSNYSKIRSLDSKYSSSKIAVLVTEGEMVNSKSSGTQSIVGQELANQIDELRADSSVKAVVLRINSPGGSVMAAATAYNSMLKLKEVKPVVVSMGTYAASGGYYVSAPADAIVASPVTLTGSIGVFGMIFNVGKAVKQILGVNIQSISTNANGAMSMVEPLNETQKTFIQKSIEKVYKEFVTLVSEGRNMSYEEVDSIAGGRVWTGAMASQIGLVDKIGTIQDAIELAAEKSGVYDYKVSVFPKGSDDFFSQMMSGISANVRSSILGYPASQTIEKIREDLISKQGVQALMPYCIEIK